VGVLKACASVAVIEEGRCVHQQIIRSGLESDVFVGSSLVDMYAKCGSIEDAGKVFEKMPSQDVVSWTAIILGHAMQGRAECIGTIPTSATGGCATELRYFCGGH
jgi:pentatricopeptide repeat protein